MQSMLTHVSYVAVYTCVLTVAHGLTIVINDVDLSQALG